MHYRKEDSASWGLGSLFVNYHKKNIRMAKLVTQILVGKKAVKCMAQEWKPEAKYWHRITSVTGPGAINHKGLVSRVRRAVHVFTTNRKQVQFCWEDGFNSKERMAFLDILAYGV